MKAARSRPPRFKLTGRERFLMQLYRTVPESARLEAGRVLFASWITRRSPEEAAEIEQRWQAAGCAFKTGVLTIRLLHDAGGRPEWNDVRANWHSPSTLGAVVCGEVRRTGAAGNVILFEPRPRHGDFERGA